ncbi:MAG: hypothetical protein AB7U45_11710 [Desulfamplus sp.]
MLQAPKSKFSELIEVLNTLIPGKKDNQFQLIRIRKEAEKLKQSNPSEAFALLGMVSCIEQDIESTHKNHMNALHYENSLRQKNLYAISLFKLDLFAHAYQYFVEIYQTTEKIDLETLDYLIRCAFLLDKDDEFNNYLIQWEKLNLHKHCLAFSEKETNIDFLEDDSRYLKKILSNIDKYIKDNPDFVQEFDNELFSLADELVDGVEI